jgi:glycosyltransferase involved in cell wall biosynthesis
MSGVSVGGRVQRLSVCAVVPYPPNTVPSQRYRIEQWIPRLRTFGIDCELMPFFHEETYRLVTGSGGATSKMLGLLRAALWRASLYSQIAMCDAVLVHREAMAFGPALMERMIARRKPLVFDFDDAIWLRNRNRVNPLAEWVKCAGKTATIARSAAAVLAGNRYLASWARRYSPAVHEVPSTIEMEGAYSRQKTHGPAAVPVVGWSGTSSTLRYLEWLRPVLEALARRHRYRLVVIGDGPPLRWPGIDLHWRPWSSAREVEDLLELDIGLMPQPDEEWARGKCGLKALQYMALGIPAVASANGVLPEIVEPGRNGFLAASHTEWLERLEGLLHDWKLRAAMGEEARATVRERYSAELHAPRVASILRSACEASTGHDFVG